MARKDRLREIEAERGDLRQHIPPLVNRGGQKAAADELDTTQPTISKWLRDHKYRKVEVWLAEDEEIIVQKEQAS